MKIRRIDPEKGDVTTTCTLQEAVQQVEEAVKNGYIVVDETTEQKQMIRNALNLTEESKLRFISPIRGG